MSVVTSVTSRRKFLAGAVVVAATPCVAAVQQTDPIFAIIERHRTAFKEFVAASLANDKVAAKQGGSKVTPG